MPMGSLQPKAHDCLGKPGPASQPSLPTSGGPWCHGLQPVHIRCTRCAVIAPKQIQHTRRGTGLNGAVETIDDEVDGNTISKTQATHHYTHTLMATV
jgi:hypothetical protein